MRNSFKPCDALITLLIGTNRVYGEKSLESFAGKMRLSASTLRDYQQGYERLARLETVACTTVLEAIRSGKLTFNHIRVAAPIESDLKFGAVSGGVTIFGFRGGYRLLSYPVWARVVFRPRWIAFTSS